MKRGPAEPKVPCKVDAVTNDRRIDGLPSHSFPWGARLRWAA